MSQVPLFVAIHLLGVAAALALGPRRRPALCCALGFPLGLVVLVLAQLGLLLTGLVLPPFVIAAIALGLTVALAVIAARRGVAERTLLFVAAWTVGFAGAALLACAADIVIMTHDSHTLVMLARVIAEDGTLRGDVIAQLDEWGSFQVIAQSLVRLTRQDLLYALPLTLGLSAIPLFAVTLWAGLGAAGAGRRGRALVVGLVVAAVFTIHMVTFHVAYLHTNFGSALYLFGFVVLFWLAEVERDPAYLPPAFLFLVALALQRTETPLVALVFLALTVAQTTLPRRAVTPWLAVFVVVVAGWFEVLAHDVGPAGAFLTPGRCRVVEAILLGAFGWWCLGARAAIRKVDRILPQLVATVTAIALVAAFALRPAHMSTSALNFWGSLSTVPSWGGIAYLVPLLALLALAAPTPPFRQAFVVGIPTFLAFVLLLVLGRDPYSNRIDDSANRMAIHVVPLLFWYLGLKLGLGMLPATAAMTTVGAERPAPGAAAP